MNKSINPDFLDRLQTSKVYLMGVKIQNLAVLNDAYEALKLVEEILEI